MMDIQGIGKLLVIIGISLIIIGSGLFLLGRLPFLNSFGSLPGDIRIQTENFSCFIPLTSMILFSILLTVIVNLAIRLFSRL